MIRNTIDTINSRITAQLATDAVQVAGIAVPVYDQQQRATSLILPDTAERLVIDSSLVWQSAHLTDGSRVVNTQLFGSFTDHQHEARFILLGLSKSESWLGFAMNSLRNTAYVVIDDVNDKTLDVLNRYWQVRPTQEKNYDPALCAFAIRYHLTGVTDEDLAELTMLQAAYLTGDQLTLIGMEQPADLIGNIVPFYGEDETGIKIGPTVDVTISDDTSYQYPSVTITMP